MQLEELKLVAAGNLINLRTAAGLTQAELGAKLNYSDKSISKWERGEAIPDAYVLTQIAELFGVTVDYILSSHTDWEPLKTPEDPKRDVVYSTSVIIAIAVLGVWTLALTAFVALWLGGMVRWKIFVAAFPVSTFTMPGKWSPNAGEKFRYAMHFETFAQAKNCADNLMHGYKKLEDYADHLDRPEYVRCVQEVQQ